jgi:hypothetical protein
LRSAAVWIPLPVKKIVAIWGRPLGRVFMPPVLEGASS